MKAGSKKMAAMKPTRKGPPIEKMEQNSFDASKKKPTGKGVSIKKGSKY